MNGRGQAITSPFRFLTGSTAFRLQFAGYRGKHEKRRRLWELQASSQLWLVQFLCRMMPHRASLKGCLIGCAILTLVFRFMYMTTIGIILYGICMIAVIAGAVLMNIAGNSHATVGGEKA